ncbi:Regulator of IME2 4 [Hyphodiscus hymeniophilus]|uniref:Regulator of IME2 4 n=1 Tax=Hyphodiscus hymeniophilus TaxID=353542 RepID=A0A9P6VN16_9HELO|nr:Regulator of IME2 4 [Hyphodiscus hymeniophilus]
MVKVYLEGSLNAVLANIVGQLSLNGDEQAINVTTGASGTYASVATVSKTGYTPSTERYTPPFNRPFAGRVENDDVFQDDVYQATTPSRRSAFSATPSGGSNDRREIIKRSKNWRSGSSSDSDDESVGFSPALNRGTARRLSFGGNTPMVVRADEAQGVYPPSCCVFVANLLQTEGEETLQMAVTQVFREFGPVFVKIRRDAKQMPFAFCQYTTSEHADRAIKEGRGRLIKGRPCRCEKAKAHRLFFVERKFGPVPTPTEVRHLLDTYGEIEFCYTASHVERTALNLNEGVILQFKLYDDGQNAQSAFRNHDMWKLVAIAGMNSSARGAINVRNLIATDTARAYLSRYETDRRSIFVGNLPAGVTEDSIKKLFEPYGSIEEILLRETSSKFEPFDRVYFAFIQFESVMAVSSILAVKTGFVLEGRSLRISQKDSENGGPKRTTRSSLATQSGSSSYAYPSPASATHSPPAHGSAASPMSMAPPAYGASPYAWAPYGSPCNYYPGNVYSDGQHFFQPPSYPAYYSYPASPAYNTTSPTTAQAYPGSPAYNTTAPTTAHAGDSPAATQSYYGAYPSYPAYPYSPQPYWGASGPTAAAQPYASPAAYPPVYSAYSPPVASSTVADDRSATPTPVGHDAVIAEDILVSH